MHTIFSEYQHNYATYTFSYAVYGIQEHRRETDDIYSRGFLPYTADPSAPQHLFYLARSVRVDLERFSDMSENRRVARKAQPLGLSLAMTEPAAMKLDDPAFVAFCTSYADTRFSGGSMDADRLRYVLTRYSASHILTFSNADTTLGYVVACITDRMLHYWYAFFDLAYLRSHCLGKWIMWRTIRWAKDQGLRYVYLGTCYGSKALYKVRDHRGCEFFDGIGWNQDLDRLKALCRQDDADDAADAGAADAFKTITPDERERIYARLFMK